MKIKDEEEKEKNIRLMLTNIFEYIFVRQSFV